MTEVSFKRMTTKELEIQDRDWLVEKITVKRKLLRKLIRGIEIRIKRVDRIRAEVDALEKQANIIQLKGSWEGWK